MMVLHDAGIDQGGFGAAEGPTPQLTVLREAAGVGMMFLQDAGKTKVESFFTDSPPPHSPDLDLLHMH